MKYKKAICLMYWNRSFRGNYAATQQYSFVSSRSSEPFVTWTNTHSSKVEEWRSQDWKLEHLETIKKKVFDIIGDVEESISALCAGLGGKCGLCKAINEHYQKDVHRKQRMTLKVDGFNFSGIQGCKNEIIILHIRFNSSQYSLFTHSLFEWFSRARKKMFIMM